MAQIDTASLTIAELREFAGFTNAEQRYIKRSLDIGLGRQDAFRLWARNPAETAAIRSQYVLYQELKGLRGEMPEGAGGIGGFDGIAQFMGTLIRLTAFDPELAAQMEVAEQVMRSRRTLLNKLAQ